MQPGRLQVIILFEFVALVGCQQSNVVSMPTSSPAFALPTYTFTSPPPHPTFTPLSAITVTPSPQPAAIFTLTPLPTMPSDKIQAKFDQLYRYNNGCKLPCWWGITPGISAWGDARNFLAQFEEHSEINEDQENPLTENPVDFIHATFSFPSPLLYNRFGTKVDFEIQNDKVVAIRLMEDVGWWMFNLKKLYTEYGNPDRVLIVPEKCSNAYSSCGATMFFVYDRDRFFSETAVSGAINGTTVSLCVSEYNSGYIVTWADGVIINLNYSNKNNSKFFPLEKGVQDHVSDFFINGNSSNDSEACFDVPIDFWG